MEHSIMDTSPGTVTVWQSGRLATRVAPRRARLTREQWLGAALLALAAAVLAIFVGVLREDVDRSELAHAAQRSGGVTQALNPQQELAQTGTAASLSAAR
jgi:hypothetical protein